MYVFTFYSFKGGVGRTMSLVNIAAELVRRGRKVLVVDFDLEAPGLETYQRLSPEKPHPGIVEYVTEFRRNLEVPNLLDYIYETKPIGKKGGRLWVMPAGRRDSTYRKALANLDWQRLYKDEAGFLLFEDTKKGWEVELKPDYVLIDSRTGDTDVLGICTRQLPDSVVLMFTPNEQNLAGLENVCRDIRREETEGLKKRIKLHFVAANVPDLYDDRRIIRRQIEAFRKRLDFTNLSGEIRRYENLHLLDQPVFVLDRPHTKLARSYRRLLRTLLKDNLADHDGATLFLEDYPKWIERRTAGSRLVMTGYDRDRAGFQVAVHANGSELSGEGKKSLQHIARHFHNDAEILGKVGDCFAKEEEYRLAETVFDQVLRLNPSSADAYFKRATCKINQGDTEGAASDLVCCLGSVDLRSDLFGPGGRLIQQCLERLSLIAPSKLSEVVDLVDKAGVDAARAGNVANYICHAEEGIPHAARLLRNYIAGAEQSDIGNGIFILAGALLRARCWEEVIELLGAKTSDGEHERSSVLVDLAFAHLGRDGKIPESICRQALQCDLGKFTSQGIQPHELASWFLWQLGNAPEALSELEIAKKEALGEINDIVSLWRFREVTIEQYLDDCRLVRRMFQGEPLRPAFLGPLPS